MVERVLAKDEVEGSTPFSRSTTIDSIAANRSIISLHFVIVNFVIVKQVILEK